MSPADVNFGNLQIVLKNVYPNRRNIAPCTFKTGDRVRVTREKNVFSKGYEQSWSDDIYKVVKSEKSLGVCYFSCKFNTFGNCPTKN